MLMSLIDYTSKYNNTCVYKKQHIASSLAMYIHIRAPGTACQTQAIIIYIVILIV